MIKKEDVMKAQKVWGDRIVEIGKNRNDRKKCVTIANKLVDELYAYAQGDVLFKPTRAHRYQFRLSKEAAVSYFIGGNDNFPTDDGFALQPWSNVRFENSGLILEEKRALAMGNYYFTGLDNNEVKVEYTFGYILVNGERLKIDLHHSSFPYRPV